MDNLFNVNQIAFMLKVHPLTIRRYIKEGKLKAVKMGGNVRVKESDFQEFSKDYSTPRNIFKKLSFERKNENKTFTDIDPLFQLQGKGASIDSDS